jgi:hypothetical protein
VLGLRYTLLDGRLSDSRTRVNRYSWTFSVNETPVTLVGGGNGVIDTIAKGRTVAVAGRISLFGKRFLAYQLWVKDTGIAAGVSPAVPAFALAVMLGGLVVVGFLPELNSKVPPVILLVSGAAASVLMLSDTVKCRALIRAARAQVTASAASLGSNNRRSGP